MADVFDAIDGFLDQARQTVAKTTDLVKKGEAIRNSITGNAPPAKPTTPQTGADLLPGFSGTTIALIVGAVVLALAFGVKSRA